MELAFDYFIYWVSGFSISLFLYFGIGSFAFFLFWKWKKDIFSKRRIQQKQRADREQINAEIKNSTFSLFLFAVIDLSVYYFQKNGYTQIYENISDYGYVYFFGSIVLMVIIHDAYFYWAHRFMHWKPIYQFVHKVHHESVDTTPYTAFSFHPLEAVVEYGIIPVFVFLFPIHFYSLLAFQIFMTVFNVIGHLGYEIYPKNWIHSPFLKFKTTGVHHNLHHSKFNGNYGLYFTWWDKWMGTEFPQYAKEFDLIQDRLEKPNLILSREITL